MSYLWPSGLFYRSWFTRQDYNWAMNWWMLPCEKNAYLSEDSGALDWLIAITVLSSLMALPALLIAHLLAWRTMLVGREGFPTPQVRHHPHHLFRTPPDGYLLRREVVPVRTSC